jgi:hypothetical protein
MRANESFFAYLKRQYDAFCAFDDRFNGRMETSPVATTIGIGLACGNILFLIFCVWYFPAFASDRATASAILAVVGLVIGICGWRRARRQSAERRRELLQSRNEAGECLRCGYDLRASPGMCPECGLPVIPPN